MSLASGSIDLKSLKVAGEGASKYITEINEGGIKIHDAGDMDNYIQLTSNGMDIYKNINSTPTCVAQFRDEIIIGEEKKSCVRITDDGYYINTKGLVPFKVEYEDMTYNEETFEIGYQLTYEDMSTTSGQSVIINEIDTVVPSSDFTLYATYVVRNMEMSGHTSASFTKGIEKEVKQNNLGCTLTLSYDGDKTFIFKMVYVGDPLDELPIDATLDRFIWEKLSSFPVMQVGIDGNSHLRIDYHSLQLIDKEGKTYFHISDLRNSEGLFTINKKFIVTYAMYDDEDEIPCDVDSVYEIIDVLDSDKNSILNTVATVEYSTENNEFIISFSDNTYKDTTCTLIYTTKSSLLKIFTFGSRNLEYDIGAHSVVLGKNCAATFNYSLAEGYETLSQGRSSHAEGESTIAYGNYSHAEGFHTQANKDASHAEGSHTIASGSWSHAEGAQTNATHVYSHAEGFHTRADGRGSHAEGYYTIAGDALNGNYSHAEGYETHAYGMYSHTEGQNTETRGAALSAHAQNKGTIASKWAQTAIGTYNIEDISTTIVHPSNSLYYGQYAFIIGNGTGDEASQRSNALTVDWNGNVMSQGMAGQVIMYAGSTAPTGWLLCNGSAVSRTTYATLFAVIGTTFGAGDGSTTFNLPDFRDRFAVGAGSAYSNNSKGGYKDAAVISHTHSISSSGGHTHTVTAKYDQDIRVESGSGTRYKATGKSTSTSMATIASGTGEHKHDVPAPTGAVAGTNRNLPPYIGINFIIATGKTY